jgi:hypothetical protein
MESSSPDPAKKITVVFCIPGRQFSDKFFMCWTETLSALIKSNKYEIAVSNKYSSQVNFARALCLGANVLAGPDQQPFQGQLDYDVLVWLDSDILFNFPMIENLIESCLKIYPVVSGIYAMEGGKQLCCVENWDLEYYVKNGAFEFMSVEKRIELLEEGREWVKCSYTGMGCMAIRKGIFEDNRLKYPWFFCDLKKLPSTNPSVPYICDGTSEDVSFIRNLIESGIIEFVLVSLKLKFGHEKTMVF